MVRSCSRAAAILSAATVGYLAGTIPSADIAARLAPGSVDLRTTGSNNPGALNAAQQLGQSWGIAVLVADAAKGALGARVGRRLGGDAGTYMAATMTIAGHIWPIWSRFQGGKGVATSAGACLTAFPPYFPIDAGVAAVSAVSSRNAETSVRISAVAWTVTSILWWRRGWRNGWGPKPTVGLPAFSAASSAMILFKFAQAERAQVQP